MFNSFLLCAGVFLSATFSLCSAECGNLYAYGVSAADQQTIVDHHNELRNLVAEGKVSGQPRATNMETLSWDAALATAAQNIANTCVFEHVRVTDDRFSVGQNLYQTGSSVVSDGADWKGAIDGWFNEHDGYTYSNQYDAAAGHYTQVVWANTKYVGCGYTFYPRDGWNNKYYVCNYGPAGNIIGQFPYQT